MGDSILKAADYLTSVSGSTDDLVGERRAMINHLGIKSSDDKQKYINDLKNIFSYLEERECHLNHLVNGKDRIFEETIIDDGLDREELRMNKGQEEKKIDHFNNEKNNKLKG